MDKQQARNIIKKTFENSFNKERFTSFIKNLLNRIEEETFIYRGQFIPDAFKSYIESLERIGKFSDGENKLDILVASLKKETSLQRARTMQRNFIAWYLNGSRGGKMKDAAIVAFVSPGEADWRFSLVKMEYKFEQTKTGRMKVKEEFTPAKRWSFLVGANENSHTAQSRLVKILADDEQNPTLTGLEEAFNIETVTREFFIKYRELFIRTKEALDKVVKNDAKIQSDFETKGINTVDFAKKLLGQIIFLYFLQKKGWFGVARDANWGAGSKQFLRELFEKVHGDYRNFFNDILEPLFYDALSRDRSDIDHWNDQFKCKIPFLNGGLFDPIGKDGGYNWVKTDIFLPDSMFSNKNRTKEGDTGDGILDIFDCYNFTVKEDEPLEKEVAIDPELLGKAYEKFNAIRPDNFEEYKKTLNSGKKGEETKFNKQYGVYYTPREIVHYMCRQSLINYLFNALNNSKVSYEKLGDNNLDMFGNKIKKEHLDLTIEHTTDTKILKEDIEMLIHMGEHISENEEIALIKKQKINEGKQKTSTYELKLPESIRKNAGLVDQKLAEITICDPAVGSGAFPVGVMSEIVKARTILNTFIANKEKRKHFDFKRQCIEHSLYGVDIDSGAVEIAKLRLWLSLVVDEEDIKNIKPLPNLDYKIVCGNSLLGLPDIAMKDIHLETEIERLKIEYFNETNPTNKRHLKNKIDDVFKQLVQSAREYSSDILDTDFEFKIHFSEVFHQKDGFDVVIGNPPYISAIEFTNMYGKDLRTVLNKNYKTARGTYDIFVLFIERGLLLTNQSGCLAFITPNKYLSANYGIALRKLILSKYALSHLVDLSPLKVFEEASVYPIISIIQGASKATEPVRVLLPPHRGIEVFQEAEFNSISFQQSMLRVLPENLWSFLLSNQGKFLSKLIKGSKQLQEYGEVSATSTASEADEYGKFIVERLQSFSMKLINTGTIDKWTSTWGITEMTHAGSRFLKPHLCLRKVSERRQEMYKAPKVLFAKIAKACEAVLDVSGEYASLNTNCFYKPNKGISIKTIAAICNSKIFMFLYEQLFGALRMSGGYFQFQAPQLRVMPIKYPDNSMEKAIDKLVDRILATKHAHSQACTSALELEIDQMVYQLYDLTEEEIKIVEDSL
jgi:hypothetical protein